MWATLWPPVSLATIGAVLERNGFEVQIIDCPASEMTWNALGIIIEEYLPQLVLWSSGTPSIDNDLSLAAFIKTISSSTITAVFGTHVTVLDRQCLRDYPALDCIIRHEPELTALELAQAIRDKKAFAAIAGLTFRRDGGEIVTNPARPFIDDLDSLPHPAWHLIDISRYRLPFSNEQFLIIAPLRGCPFNCTFCTCQTYYGRKLRKRSVANVMKEIQYDMARFGLKNFFIWAETFVVDKHYVEQLCRAIIEERLAISWTCNSRVDTVDAALLKLMKQAGCWMISFGIESAEQSILDEVHKGTTVEQARDAVRWAHEAGIKAVGHIILGLPGETAASIKKTMQYTKTLGLDLAQYYCAVPFPGSALYERACQEGWIQDYDFSHFKQDHAVMELPTISATDVNQCRTRAYRDFYFAPRNILNVAKLIGWKHAGKTLRSVMDFLGWTK